LELEDEDDPDDDECLDGSLLLEELLLSLELPLCLLLLEEDELLDEPEPLLELLE